MSPLVGFVIGACIMMALLWFYREIRKAPLQDDPRNNEHFAQGSLGECFWYGKRPACDRWAIVQVRGITKVGLCQHCFNEDQPKEIWKP